MQAVPHAEGDRAATAITNVNDGSGEDKVEAQMCHCLWHT